MIPAKVNLKMYQGSTFKEMFRWESNELVYIPISNIDQSAPIEITTSVPHDIPIGWRTKVTNVIGMKEINSSDAYRIVTRGTGNTVKFNAVNAVGFTPYVSGGVLEYYKPVDLATYSARMQIRKKVNSNDILAEYSTLDGTIVLDNVYKTVTILVDASVTAAYTFSFGVYSLEMVEGAIVTPLAYGNITLIKEITR